MTPRPQVPHLPFIQAMSECGDDHAAWQALAAGYLAMRVFDDWLLLGPARIALAMQESKIIADVAAIGSPYHEERWVLERALHQLMHAPDGTPDAVVGPLLGYAKLLEERGAWAPAADVYQTVACGLENYQDGSPPWESIALTRLREGQCWRNGQDYVQAVTAYEAVVAVAETLDNDILRLQGRLGIANVDRVRGALPVAETALTQLLEEADRCSKYVAVLLKSAVLHSRGAVRVARGRYDDALIDLYTAYGETTDPFERELILADLGACASTACYRDAARNALEVLALTAQRTISRQIAICNLIEIATLDGNQIAFERWRSAFVFTDAIPLTRAYAKLYIARGIERFYGQDRVLPALQEAVDYASKAKIHQLEFEALADIERLKQARAPQPSIAKPLPRRLAHIGEALQELRTFAELER